MFVDFAVNKTGDILFTENNINYKPLNIKFNISKTISQKISFNIEEDSEDIHNSKDYLKVSFLIEKDSNTVPNLIYKDKDALAQLISLQLKDVLGELPYRIDNGSKLCLFKHENITPEILNYMKIYLESFLKKYLQNPNVTITPIIDYSNGYKQTVEIFIKNNNDLILQYKVER